MKIKYGPKPKSSYIVTASSTRARESIAKAAHGKVNIGRKGSQKITGATGLKRTHGAPRDED